MIMAEDPEGPCQDPIVAYKRQTVPFKRNLSRLLAGDDIPDLLGILVNGAV